MGNDESRRGEASVAEQSRRSQMVESDSADSFRPVPDCDVAAGARRRRFTAEYKLRILREADGCKEPGEIGTLLRREGLYSSHLAQWRRQREEAAQAQLNARKRGPKPRHREPRVRQLERENARLQRRLERVQTLLENHRKGAETLRVPSTSPDVRDDE